MASSAVFNAICSVYLHTSSVVELLHCSDACLAAVLWSTVLCKFYYPCPTHTSDR